MFVCVCLCTYRSTQAALADLLLVYRGGGGGDMSIFEISHWPFLRGILKNTP